jgi:hypothetical protein
MPAVSEAALLRHLMEVPLAGNGVEGEGRSPLEMGPAGFEPATLGL